MRATVTARRPAGAQPGAGGTELATSLLLWGQCYRCGVCHWDRQGGGGGEPTRGCAGPSEAAWEWAWRAGFPQKFRNALPGLLDAKLSRRVSGGLSRGVGWCPAARGVGEEIRCDLEKQGVTAGPPVGLSGKPAGAGGSGSAQRPSQPLQHLILGMVWRQALPWQP